MVKVHSFESFGTVDGPGVRFVVFFAGCPLRCQYCHNPDTWDINNSQDFSTDEILVNYQKYAEFLKGGGLTVSGGEPLMQIDQLIELFSKAKAMGIHTTLDTSGCTFSMSNHRVLEKFDKLIAVCDLFMVDIKQIDNEKHQRLTGQSNAATLSFIKYLDQRKANIRIRYVLVPGISDDLKDLFKLGYFLQSIDHLEKIEILPYHIFGITKWQQLNLKYPLEGVREANSTDVEKAYAIIEAGRKYQI